jgi:hypothetical protein
VNTDILADVPALIRTVTLPGAAGGIAAFLLALKKGHYRNNKYMAKALIELGGAVVCSSALAVSFPLSEWRTFVAFCMGVAWSSLIQVIRSRITKVIEAALGESSNGGDSR